MGGFQIIKWFKFRMSKSSWIILIGFLVLFGLDLYTTFSVGDIVKHLESNPIYILTGSWTLIILLNLVTLYFLLKANDSKGAGSRFIACNFFVWFTGLRILVVINNFKMSSLVKAGTVTMEMAAATPDIVKLNHYTLQLIAAMYAPVLITLLVYLLFRLDNEVERKCN